MEFGFYPERLDLKSGDVRISTLPDLDDKQTKVRESKWTHGNWTYAPSLERHDMFADKVSALPYSGRVFGLPKTHRLDHGNTDDDEHKRFLMWCFGFFVGMRITDTEAGFLDATPLKPGSLCDFLIAKPSLEAGIHAADAFYCEHGSNTRISKGIVAAVHALFLAQSPLFLDYERFLHLYICLDGCFSVHRAIRGQSTRGIGHGERIHEMCQSFGMTTPSWADPNATPIAAYRNDTIHEGLFFGEPMGFQIFRGTGDGNNTLLEMENLACRIIVGLLGLGHADYVRSPIDDRMTRMLKL